LFLQKFPDLVFSSGLVTAFQALSKERLLVDAAVVLKPLKANLEGILKKN
jgi:hypothetical protein